MSVKSKILGWLGKRVGSYFSRKFLTPAISTGLVVWAMKALSVESVEVELRLKMVIAGGIFAMAIVYEIMQGLFDRQNPSDDL